MKKLYISIISGLLLCLVFSNTVFGQPSNYWSFKYETRNKQGATLFPCTQNPTLYNSFAECVRGKQERLSMSYGPYVYVICEDCIKHGAANPNPPDQSGTGNTNSNISSSININGTSQGSAFFSSTPSRETVDWMNDVNTKNQVLGTNSENSGDFDREYENAMLQIPSQELKVSEWEIADYVKDVFTGENTQFGGNTPSGLCDLVDKSFSEQMGYSPNQISFLSGSERRNAINSYNDLGERYAYKANEIYSNTVDDWKKRLKTPDWETIYNSIDNPQRFVSIISEAGARNDNHIPLPISSDTENFYFYLEGKNEMMTVPKNGSSFTLSPLDGGSIDRILQQSRVYGGAHIAGTVNSLSGIQYDLNPDGSCSKYLPRKTSTSVGLVGISQKADIIDIKKINSPQLVFSEDKKVHINTSKPFSLYLTAEMSVSTPISITTDGSTTTTEVSAGKGFKVKGSVTVSNSNGRIEGGTLGGGVDFAIAGVTAEGVIGKDKGGLKFSGNIGPFGESLEIGLKGFKQSDANYLANQLPMEVEKQLYNDFFNNPSMVNTLIVTDKNPMNIQTRNLTAKEINAVKNAINTNIDKKIMEKTAITSTQFNTFRPCTITQYR